MKISKRYSFDYDSFRKMLAFFVLIAFPTLVLFIIEPLFKSWGTTNHQDSYGDQKEFLRQLFFFTSVVLIWPFFYLIKFKKWEREQPKTKAFIWSLTSILMGYLTLQYSLYLYGDLSFLLDSLMLLCPSLIAGFSFYLFSIREFKEKLQQKSKRDQLEKEQDEIKSKNEHATSNNSHC